MWSNVAPAYLRPMSRHRVTLRGVDINGNHQGMTARHLHLDQVHIIFRPNADIAAPEFVHGDDSTKTWRAETAHLLVRTVPGEQHILFSSGTQDGVSPALTGANAPTSTATTATVREPTRSLVYSAAMSLVPHVEGNEDYWCRTYRPIRDLPVANLLNGVSELEIELLFPLLFNDNQAPFTEVPNYRILKVLCEFSVDR